MDFWDNNVDGLDFTHINEGFSGWPMPLGAGGHAYFGFIGGLLESSDGTTPYENLLLDAATGQTPLDYAHPHLPSTVPADALLLSLGDWE